MNVELLSAAAQRFRPLKAVKYMPSLFCSVKHQWHIFTPVFEQFLTGVPTPLSGSEKAYSTRCTLN